MRKTKELKLYSFDIFDTLITRKVAKPTGIFVLAQDIIKNDANFSDIPEDVKVNFVNYRIGAEYYCRRINIQWHKHRDITLDSIYEHIKNSYFLSSIQAEKLKNLEIKLEINSVVPIYENIEKVKKLLHAGKRVVLISDMYLPQTVIKQMLYKADPILPEIKLYLSSELGFMKTTSELFKYVKEAENVNYKEWQHCGDNPIADYSRANKLGIKSHLYKYVNLEEYETKLLNKHGKLPIVQLTVGCTKNLRLNSANKNLKYDVGCSFAGTILAPYLFWLLKKAEKASIKRLYFIARDGYVLKAIADHIIEKENLDIKTHYVYGSRKAWRLCALSTKNEELYKQFIESSVNDNNKLDEVFGLSKEELQEILPKHLKKYYKSSIRRELKKYLLEDTTILDVALNKNYLQQVNTINYLKNNIDYSDNHFAFVDLDGSGLTQNCLACMFSKFYAEPIQSFYLASTPLCFEPVNLKKFYFLTLKKPFMGYMLELLTRAPHGQTLGFDNNANPVLEDFDKSSLENWDFNAYLNGMLDFSSYLSDYFELCPYSSLENQLIMDFYINYLCENPNRKLANILGTLSHKSFGLEAEEFAPKIGFFGALKYLFTKRINTGNILFSKARSHKLIQKIIAFKLRYPKFHKSIVNISINHHRKIAKLTILGISISFRHLLWAKEM